MGQFYEEVQHINIYSPTDPEGWPVWNILETKMEFTEVSKTLYELCDLPIEVRLQNESPSIYLKIVHASCSACTLSLPNTSHKLCHCRAEPKAVLWKRMSEIHV